MISYRVQLMSATNWWLRSPNTNNSNNALNVNTNGNWNNNNCSNSYGVRPALMECETSSLANAVHHRIKGSHILSNAYQADDKYITPRPAADLRRSWLPGESRPVVEKPGEGSSLQRRPPPNL